MMFSFQFGSVVVRDLYPPFLLFSLVFVLLSFVLLFETSMSVTSSVAILDVRAGIEEAWRPGSMMIK